MYLIIANPVAGKGRSLKTLSLATKLLDKACAKYKIIKTRYPGHATQIASDAVKRGEKNILALGGDGTVLEVAKGLLNTDSVLGIIPGGTGNDFIRSLNVSNNLEAAIENILAGNTKKVDVGMANDNYFLNVAGTGFDVCVVEYTKKTNRFFTGMPAYYLAVLISILKYKGQTMTIVANGQSITKKLMLIAIANGKQYGGGMKVAPMAKPDDGIFHITTIDMPSKLKILFMLPRFIKGQHEKFTEIKSFVCDEIEVLCENTLSINMDGDLIGTTPVKFKLLKSALNVFSPV
ncbi:MAG: diacylglycerol kinase family lipid kinase [Eubacteriales bacterium]